MTAQSDFEALLGSGSGQTAGFAIPELTPSLARRLIGRIHALRWYLNRYSLELNFKHKKLRLTDFLSLARECGFDGVQLHVARGDPRVSLAEESDSYLKTLADQKGEKKLDIQAPAQNRAEGRLVQV